LEEAQLKAVIEALIFVSETPLTLDRIREVVGGNRRDLERLISELREDYRRAERGLDLAEVAEGYQFRTRPEHAEWIKKLKRTKAPTLSQPALETLAIVAYRQPVVRQDVERIRGVDSGGVLRTLLERKLIKIIGKKDVPGKPLVYGTTPRFLEVFGLKDLSELPTLKDLKREGLSPSVTEEFSAASPGQAGIEATAEESGLLENSGNSENGPSSETAEDSQ